MVKYMSSIQQKHISHDTKGETFDDPAVIEETFGTISEISLTYVVPGTWNEKN